MPSPTMATTLPCFCSVLIRVTLSPGSASACPHTPHHTPHTTRTSQQNMNEEEDTCMSYEDEDTCMSYEDEDTCQQNMNPHKYAHLDQ